MRPGPPWRRYLRFWRADPDRDVDDELGFHLESRIAEFAARGMSPEEARAAALARFGDIARVRDECRTIVHHEERRMARALFLDAIRQDTRYAVRTLLRTPGFTLIAALTLGLGIGANAAIFSVVNGVFLRPLTTREPDRLVAIGMTQGGLGIVVSSLSWPNYLDLRANRELFEDVMAHGLAIVSERAGERAERRFYATVSENFFTMLDLRAQVGRFFTPDEARRGQQLIVLSDAAWRARFAADSTVAGRVVHLNGLPFTVVGVAPRGFTGVEAMISPDGYFPALTMRALFPSERRGFEQRSYGNWKLKARLAPGVSLEEARTRAAVIASELERRYPEANRGWRVVIEPERWARPDIAVADMIPRITIVFMTLVAAVLFIACANVGNLLLARGSGRRAEMALRTALGATRGRVLHQLLTESVILALLGQVVAVVVAIVVTRWLGSIRFGIDAPVQFALDPDARVWAFTFVAAVLAGLVAGVGPAFGAARASAHDVLKEGGARGTAGRATTRLRGTLVVVQVAVSLVLLVCAGLFVRGLGTASHADFGFRPNGQLIASVDVSLQRYDAGRAERFTRDFLERARLLPGVRAAALARTVPLGYNSVSEDLSPEDPGMAKDGRLSILTNSVSRDYFAAMGIALLEGRDFSVRDDSTGPRVAIINRSLAERLWPGRSALGRRIKLGVREVEHEVIGVVQDGKYLFMTDRARPYIYRHMAQYPSVPVTLHLRTDGDPAALAPAVRRLVAAIDPELAVYDVRTMEAHLRDGLALLFVRLGATLAGAIGLLGLIQTVVGLYGVVAYTVAQRTREIGIRMALGAARSRILGEVVRSGMRLTLTGLAIGGVFAMVATRGLSALIYGVAPTDAVSFAGAALVLAVSAGVASWIPARRASRLEPVSALRDA